MAQETSPDAGHECPGCPLTDAVAARDTRELAALSRRDFVSMAALSTIALTLTACGTGELTAAEKLLAAQQNAPTPPSTTPPATTPPATTPPATTPPTTPANPPVGANQIGVTIASYPALATVGGVAKVSSSPAVALTRTATGFAAYSLRCPHQGTTVTLQASTNTWRCPNHGALFSAAGAWTGGNQRTTNLVARTVTPNGDKTFVVVNLT